MSKQNDGSIGSIVSDMDDELKASASTIEDIIGEMLDAGDDAVDTDSIVERLRDVEGTLKSVAARLY